MEEGEEEGEKKRSGGAREFAAGVTATPRRDRSPTISHESTIDISMSRELKFLEKQNRTHAWLRSGTMKSSAATAGRSKRDTESG